MARAHGRNANIYVGIGSSSSAATPLTYTAKWSLDGKTDKADATAFGDSNKVVIAGLPDAALSFEGFWDTATNGTWTAAQDGQQRHVYLYPSTPSSSGTYWCGDFYLDFSIDVAVDGVIKIKGTGSPATAVTKFN